MEGYAGSPDGQSVARRRKLLDAMMKQSQEAPLVGNTGGWQAALKVLAGVLHNKQGERIAADEKAGQAVYGQELGEETNAYMTRMQGKPGEQMTAQQVDALMNRDQAPQLADPVAANPREAIVRAMTSQKPEMQALGKAGMTELAKNVGKGAVAEKFNETPRTFKNAKGQLITALIGDQGTVRELPGYEPPPEFAATGDGHIWNKGEGKGTGTYVGQTYSAPGPVATDANGKPIIGQAETSSGKIHSLDKADNSIRINNTPTTIMAAQKAGFEEWSKGAAKTVGELAEQARNATNVLAQANQLESLNKAGVMQGPLANPAIWLGQLSNSVGIKLSSEGQARLQNSETFENTAAELWLATMNANGGSRGLVKEESERIARSLPALIQTPEGRQQILAVMRRGAQQRINDAQTAQKEYGLALTTQDPQKFTFGLSAAQLPNTTAPPATPAGVAQPPQKGGVLTLEEYLKRK